MRSGPESPTGARLVRFEYCFSLIVFTIRRQSPIYLTESWQGRYLRGLGYSLLAIVLGPWGVPWGLIYTPWAMWVNLTGGVDETDAYAVPAIVRALPPSDSSRPIPTAGPAGRRDRPIGGYDERHQRRVEGCGVRVLRGPEAEVLDLAFSPDGTAIAAGFKHHSVYLWNLEAASPRLCDW